jgi:putative flippase GtrA
VRRPSIQAILTAAVVALSAGFVLTRLEPSLLFANTTPSGGDMGAHVWAPAYLRDHLLPRFRFTGWTPDWYAGFPAFHFYFPLPSLLIVLLDLLLPYGVAFKLVSVLGAVTLPVSAYVFGRLSGLRFPGPPLLAVAVLPFLFDTSFTIYGGNIPSLLAGEFAFSLSLSLALVFLGVLVRGLETGRHRALVAVLLALTVLSHAIPAMFAISAAIVLLILRLDRHRLRYVATVMLVAGMLTAFWSLPFVFRLAFTNDLGWVKITDYLRTLFPPHIRWILPLAGAGLIGAIGMRLHSGVAIAAMGMLAGVAFVVAPEGRIWNARLLPFWFLCLYLLAGVGVSEVGRALGGVFARDPDRPARWPALATPAVVLVGTIVLGVGPLRALPAWLPIRPGQGSFVPGWARWNFSGYEGKAAYPEYRALIETMNRLPCGRAMWEYEPELDRYGTPMALMLLPYWTKGCIGSMEGLFFESSPTTPFHFINQSELSKNPSRPQRDLPYQDLNVAMGVKHLQLLGVRYYLATSPEALAQARVDPNLIPVAGSGPWEIFEVANASLVSPLSYEPVVMNGIGNSQKKWLPVALPFYMNPESWDVLRAGAGPTSWAKVDPDDPIPRLPVRPAQITGIRSSDNRIAFEVDRPGSPVLVKASYFPNWKVHGADGPWRVAPNLMVVIPTARTVELYYGYTPVDIAGWLLTLLGLVGVLLLSRRALQFPEPPGIERFRRFAAITTLITAIDFGILLFLRLQFGVPLLVADVVSISVAATASYLLHRSITFGDDPHIRWVREPFMFVAVTAAAGLIDLVALGAAAGVLGSTSTVPLLAAKSLAVAAAGAVRLAVYRRRLFVAVREVQATPAFRPEPPGELRLSVIVPAFNEGRRIEETIGGIRAALAEVMGNELEIVVVDDGSDDDTVERARTAGADRVIVLPGNRGKGAAVRAGALAARGRVVAFIDADLSYSPDQLLTLLAEVEAGWDLVVGSRKHIKTSTLIRAGRLREVSGRIFNLLTRALLLGQYRDTQCGIKAFRSDVARLLFSKSRLERFAFDVETFHLAERYRLSLKEVPVSVANVEASTVRVALDALRMVRDVFLIRRWAGAGHYDLLPEDHALPKLVGSKAIIGWRVEKNRGY